MNRPGESAPPTEPTPSLLAEARALLAAYGLRARKRLGQNFLIAPAIHNAVVEAADLTGTDVVVEVGPGLGFLTRALAPRAGCVIAVELDEVLADLLREQLAGQPHVHILAADILQVPPAEILAGAGLPAGTPYKVVANLPYYITSPVLRHFFEAARKPRLLAVMVQREVAQRIVARPPKMSLLAVAVQVYGSPRIVRTVPPGAFFPRPAVASAILRIDVADRPRVDADDLNRFFALVAAGFSQPRKQIHNPLTQRLALPPGAAVEVLRAAGIDPARRAQTLSLAEWERLYRMLSDSNRS
ncbi:MAG: ribosomal RNA small subunit methyltransferase A [Chloroflexi bacterium]|nr:ribosomal RNA small subunit methyltransferase A [Chloroflexota bacterium]